MTNRVIPTGMVSRIVWAINPPSPARTRIRRLTNRRKIQTRAASTAAANKEIRNDSGNELRLRLSNGEQVNRLAALSLELGK